MPGHGTIPSGLTTIKWQDMAKVVEIGMKRLKEKLGDKPIHIMGYSTGAALALNYTFNAIKNDNLTIPSSLIFYSPAIGVSKFAPLAVWQNRLAYLFSIRKLKWNSIEPEYDPFKYNSFAINAGDQIYRLCNKIQTKFDEYNKKSFPPVLTFQSIVDNTISVPDVVNNLYKRLPKGNHSLVMFDINHNFSNKLLIKDNVNNNLIKLRQNTQNKNYTFDLISNKNSKDGQLELIRDGKVIKKLSYYWPKSIFSLSHLAMPISMHDKLYGENNISQKNSIIKLGQMAMYGESNILYVSSSSSLRQRWNPFHKYVKYRVEKFLGL
jgi:esterase/lipase